MLWLSGLFVEFHFLQCSKSCFGHGGFYSTYRVIKLSWSPRPWCDLAVWDLSCFSLAMVGPYWRHMPIGFRWDVKSDDAGNAPHCSGEPGSQGL